MKKTNREGFRSENGSIISYAGVPTATESFGF
jgi:hypothetical protein